MVTKVADEKSTESITVSKALADSHGYTTTVNGNLTKIDRSYEGD